MTTRVSKKPVKKLDSESKIKHDVGSRIRSIRVRMGKSQSDVADILKITAGAYAKIERGETDIAVTRLFQLAGVFQVDIISFLKDGVSAVKNPGEDGGNVAVAFLIKEFENIRNELDDLKKQRKK